MHPIVEYLRTHSVESLEELGVYARPSSKNPNKFGLNYDQIEGVSGNPLVEECRGLVLRKPRAPGADYEVLAQPFRRFYNFGSGHAAELDWSTVEFQDKLDGTCCIVYFDSDLETWCVGTRNVPDGDVSIQGGRTITEMFWPVYTARYGPWHGDPDKTYVFEYVGPDNQICVRYEESDTILLATFVTATGEEIPSPIVPRYTFKSLEEATAWLATQPAYMKEGFILRDAFGARVKFKSQQYVLLAKTLSTVNTDESLVELVLMEQSDDLAPYLPQAKKDKIERYADVLAHWSHGLVEFGRELHARCATRKDAAAEVKRSSYADWIGEVLTIWAKPELHFGDIAGMAKIDIKGRQVVRPNFVERVTRELNKLTEKKE